MAFELKEFDDGGLGEIAASITSKKPMVLWKERDRDYQVWLEPDYLYIEDLRVNIFSGEFYKFSRETEKYEIDHDVYYFFNPRTGRLVYAENGSNLTVCIINFIRETGKEVDEAENLPCIYKLDNGEFLRKKVLPRKKL